MKLTNWFLNFDFTGRARRSHAWANWATWWAVLVAEFLLLAVVFPGRAVLWIIALTALVSLVDHCAMYFRRAHDTGRSGWICLLFLLPVVNLLAFYWLMIDDSDRGANKYGPAVKPFATAQADVFG